MLANESFRLGEVSRAAVRYSFVTPAWDVVPCRLPAVDVFGRELVTPRWWMSANCRCLSGYWQHGFQLIPILGPMSRSGSAQVVGSERADNERVSIGQPVACYRLLNRTGVPLGRAGSAGLSVKQQHN